MMAAMTPAGPCRAAPEPVRISELGLSMWGLAIAGEVTGDERYTDWAERGFAILDETQNRSPDPIGRGDWWATYTVRGGDAAAALGRPPQFTYQSRPLVPGTTMAYAPRAMRLIAGREGWEMPDVRPPAP